MLVPRCEAVVALARLGGARDSPEHDVVYVNCSAIHLNQANIALGVGGVGGRDDQLPVSEYLDSIADDSDSHLVVAWRGSGPFEACKLIEVNPASAIVARHE